MCEVLEVPRSTYYKKLKPITSNREKENRKYKKLILKIYIESRKLYGAPKIHKKLLNQGISISIKRVQRLMKELGIKSQVVKKFKHYPSKPIVEGKENILKRDFTTTDINQKWVADITYIHTIKDGWCYLATVLDLHTKKVIGYCFSKKMDTTIVIEALRRAYQKQRPENFVILHTDLGSQYTSAEFAKVVKELKIKHSFSQKGSPYDNAPIESFHAILKKEEVYRSKYLDYHSARLAIFNYIESWYNKKRIHSAIGYLTPDELESIIRKSA
ncbi:Transposase InsO and inactivated derivatives [Anaerobranca californiensis DSM 14826]|jgi:transposase InsO family protein|uniref:Transposase InsO and inactivated derivatives n=2 Tax=Anaerobranca TaxID=42447 RepID=A0A1M6R382_9FIRM|nr:Transposase InsO and inactivated derivatives [Anaerobranca californiensis DSM 14826]